MSRDYLPKPDAAFGPWLENFVVYANAHLGPLGILLNDLIPVIDANDAWKAAYPAHVAAQAAAQSATQAKDAARAAAEAEVRALVRRLQASPAVSDAERAALGITVPDAEPSPVGPPTTAPVVKVEAVARLRHVIHFADAATPTKMAKPRGVSGAEIWVKLAAVADPVPTDPKALTFVALDTRTPYTLDFDGADGGKNAHYMLRWVNTKGEKGPWSETATATVGA